jgi:hypothetical protein
MDNFGQVMNLPGAYGSGDPGATGDARAVFKQMTQWQCRRKNLSQTIA